MSSLGSQELPDSVTEFLGYIRRKNVRLWSENGTLRYKAPKGALTEAEIERLKGSRSQLAAVLGRLDDQSGLVTRLQLNRAPLTFSQLAHWHVYELRDRTAIRQIASATRISGQLSIRALRESLLQVICHHDSLRTRIVMCDEVPVQEVSEVAGRALQVEDLTALSPSGRERETLKVIDQLILEPIDLSTGPLFGTQLLKLADDEHVLIMAMEHMIADAFSMNILLRDLFHTYVALSRGQAHGLPPIAIQFADYALWQRNSHAAWLEKHSSYWEQRLTGAGRCRFPVEAGDKVETRTGWGTARFGINRQLKRELEEWSRLRRTTLVMAVFTAYAALVLRWCVASDVVIQYQSDGRVSQKILNTIGYFASVLYLRIELCEGDSFVELLSRVTQEYCKAYEHADFSYMESRLPRPEFAKNSGFNWIPPIYGTELCELDAEDEAVNIAPVPFEHPMLRNLEKDGEPSVLLYEGAHEIAGEVCFPSSRFAMATMERFGRNLILFVEKLLREPETRVADIALI